MSSQKFALLFDTFRERCDSEENKRRLRLWSDPGIIRLGQGTLRPSEYAFETKQVPIVVDPEITFWGDYFGFSIKDYLLDAEEYLKRFLQIQIERFDNIPDDYPLTKNIPLFFYAVLEPSLFGSKIHFSDHKSPWLLNEPVLKNLDDVDRLEEPDFKKSGLMPVVHELYEKILNLCPEDFTVNFPVWRRGIFGIAVHLYGFSNILEDLVIQPKSTRKLMAFITKVRKSWTQERNKYVDEPMSKAVLGNDEVNCPVISPELYLSSVFPFEKELCEHSGGICYYHSCGNLTELLPHIKNLGVIDLLHVSPWTDTEKAIDIFKDNEHTFLQICFDVVDEILHAEQAQVAQIIDTAKEKIKGIRSTAWLPAIDTYKSPGHTLKTIQEWVTLFKRKSVILS